MSTSVHSDRSAGCGCAHVHVVQEGSGNVLIAERKSRPIVLDGQARSDGLPLQLGREGRARAGQVCCPDPTGMAAVIPLREQTRCIVADRARHPGTRSRGWKPEGPGPERRAILGSSPCREGRILQAHPSRELLGYLLPIDSGPVADPSEPSLHRPGKIALRNHVENGTENAPEATRKLG
jgi:hypothetical protein